MKVEYITDSFKKYNEDSHGSTKHAYWVLDGASALNKHNFTDAENDVYWVVNWWTDYLESHLDEMNQSIGAIIESGVHKLNEAFSKFVDLETLTALDVVSLGISVVRIKDDSIEYFVLGDVEVNMKLKSGDFLSFTDTSIKAFDQKVIDLMRSDKSRQEKIVFKDFTQRELDLLKVNRSKMNSEEGYYILAHEHKVIQYGIQGKVPRDAVETVMLYSDGFAQLYNSFTLAEVFQESKMKGLKTVVLNLRNREKDDAKMKSYERLKKHDDVTAISIELP